MRGGADAQFCAPQVLQYLEPGFNMVRQVLQNEIAGPSGEIGADGG
jgi:hypothetical protein